MLEHSSSSSSSTSTSTTSQRVDPQQQHQQLECVACSSPCSMFPLPIYKLTSCDYVMIPACPFLSTCVIHVTYIPKGNQVSYHLIGWPRGNSNFPWTGLALDFRFFSWSSKLPLVFCATHTTFSFIMVLLHSMSGCRLQQSFGVPAVTAISIRILCTSVFIRSRV